MSYQIFQRRLNAPPWEDAQYFVGSHGEKFWIIWPDEQEDVAKLRVLYRGRHVGLVIIEEKKRRLIIHEIHVLRRYRKHGVGKGILKEIIQWARENNFQETGLVKPDEYTTFEYLQEWYKRQGFKA